MQELKALNIRTGLVSNTDSRMREPELTPQTLGVRHSYFVTGLVIGDLGIEPYLDPVLLSEEQGVEKPSAEIFQRACNIAGVQLGEVLHVGDELKA